MASAADWGGAQAVADWGVRRCAGCGAAVDFWGADVDLMIGVGLVHARCVEFVAAVMLVLHPEIADLALPAPAAVA